MGRPQAFDTASAVRAARHVFWTEGYDEASMPDLEAATGLCRSSIYHAFGNKRGLFDASLLSYLDEVVRPRLQPMITAPIAPDAIETYLASLRTLTCEQTQHTGGCLMVNAASSTLARDEAVREAVASYRAELTAALRSGVRARRPELAQEDAERRAQTCAASVIAAFSIAKADPAGAAGYLDLALDAVLA